MSMRLDTVLTLGLVMLPFTALRLGIVGPGEVFVAIFFVLLALGGHFRLSKRVKGAEFSIFWIVFIFSVSLGAIWNLVSSAPTSTPSKTLFDLGSYAFIALALTSMESARRAGVLDVEKTSRRWLVWSAVLVAGLFQVAQVAPTFLGAPLFYYDKFVPWSDNPHQLTTSFIPLIFIGLHFLSTGRNRRTQLVAFFATCVLAACTIGTGAAKSALGVGLGITYLVMASVTQKVGLKLGLLFSLLLCIAIFSLFWVNEWWPLLQLAFLELDASGDRSFLYSAGLEASDSIVGRGPGAHILMNGEFYDAHQSLLTVWLQGGVLGMVAFLLMLYWLAKKLIGSPALFGGFIAIFIYISGGDVLRRLPIWAGLFAMVCLATESASRRSAAPSSLDPGSARGRNT